jgi:hypothetical protein
MRPNYRTNQIGGPKTDEHSNHRPHQESRTGKNFCEIEHGEFLPLLGRVRYRTPTYWSCQISARVARPPPKFFDPKFRWWSVLGLGHPTMGHVENVDRADTRGDGAVVDPRGGNDENVSADIASDEP